MTVSKQIQKNQLFDVFQQLITDIQAISEGDCQLAIADIDQTFQNQRIRIGYSVKGLIPENYAVEKLIDGGSKR